LFHNGKDSLAVEKLKKAIDMDSSKTDLLGEIGGICFKQKKYSDAATWYAKKIASNMNISTNDYYYLGRSYYANKEYGKADTAFMKVTERNPELAIGYIWRARANNQMDDEKKPKYLAKPYYEEYLKRAKPEEKKDLEETYDYLGRHYIQKKEFAYARWCWEKVRELNPNNATAKTALNSAEIKAIQPRDPFSQ
jgi:uncharacterized protein HemY